MVTHSDRTGRSRAGAGELTIRLVPDTPRSGLGVDDSVTMFGLLAPAATSYRCQPLQERPGLSRPTNRVACGSSLSIQGPIFSK